MFIPLYGTCAFRLGGGGEINFICFFSNLFAASTASIVSTKSPIKKNKVFQLQTLPNQGDGVGGCLSVSGGSRYS